MFKTAYNAKDFPSSGEKNTGEVIVETAGYMSPEQQVKNFILSGERLDAYRKNLSYDFDNGIEDISFNDLTRHPDFDAADASAMINDFNDRIAQANNAASQGTEYENIKNNVSQPGQKDADPGDGSE